MTLLGFGGLARIFFTLFVMPCVFSFIILHLLAAGSCASILLASGRARLRAVVVDGGGILVLVNLSSLIFGFWGRGIGSTGATTGLGGGVGFFGGGG